MSKQPVVVIQSSDGQDFEKQCIYLVTQGYKLMSASGELVNSEQYDFCSSFTAIFALPEVLAASVAPQVLTDMSESLKEIAAMTGVNPYP